ncbi:MULTISPECIES: hypothetical protein [unclassified Streptomyces]|uniref:hypothetical protein n=1 Tax=Streptomycetaceae TaxID=2062 RepID=UPI002E794993|nr:MULTISPECIES: hypothetical protein [unclassified Streptomyces]MED7954847.1 hypothetical protein [Streptomyces sp. BE303]MEE1822354.1 hypothetical protein [Streptomyces sp. BE20]
MAYQGYRPTGAPTGAGRRPRIPSRLLPGFGLRGPRREKHVLAVGDLAALAFPVGDDGVLIGQDVHRAQPAVLGLFRPGAYDLVLVGGVWTAQVIALRAAATGARVAVETARAHLWGPLAQAAGGGQPCVTVHQVGRLGPQGASVTSPVLVVRDLGARPPGSRLSATPWQTTLTVLPYLGPNAARVLNAADLVGVQRVSPQEAELIGRVLSLGPPEVGALPTLAEDLTLWTTRMSRQYVRVVAGQAERQVLGGPRRID